MRPANVYFLVICILQMWDKVTITSGRPTMALPFAFILMVQAIKDIIEDAAKHKADNLQNGRLVLVYDPDTHAWAQRKWYEVKVGEVLKILNKEFVPADVVVVGSSDQENNGVFINTKSLDGETDLKIREVPNDLIEPFTDDLAFAKKIGGKITCQGPTKILTKFEGAYVPAPAQAGGGKKMPLSLNNCIFRGCQIKQTEYCIGVSFFCGGVEGVELVWVGGGGGDL
jgi:magnesium-transporting ATPase (P-type)